ncbi:hypothetical protein DUI87_17169 [Hirundo rustica rustica]|uniref:Uncharacterized protein n=1 Tax=Hirundo rustica rustica TaxID=333673 RepID=A0A3M0K3C5_HIRRU|nr:hypothetical protein DUI87_17169 [Hirundo rustica rustica]
MPLPSPCSGKSDSISHHHQLGHSGLSSPISPPQQELADQRCTGEWRGDGVRSLSRRRLVGCRAAGATGKMMREAPGWEGQKLMQRCSFDANPCVCKDVSPWFGVHGAQRSHHNPLLAAQSQQLPHSYGDSWFAKDLNHNALQSSFHTYSYFKSTREYNPDLQTENSADHGILWD